MKINYSNQPFELASDNSIFLAGPTPRSPDVKSWRPEALRILEKIGYTGVVYVPEPMTEYLDQVEWEYMGLENAKIIVFWVPREVKTMPGFTTNVEFGRYVGSSRARYGRPEIAHKTYYLDWLYEKMNKKWGFKRGQPHKTLEGLLKHAAEDSMKLTDREIAEWVFG